MDSIPTISACASRIRNRRLQPIELVEQCLARIQKYDGRLHAWAHVDEAAARREAAPLGQEAAEGRCRSPLHGIPVGIKDIFDVAGMPTRAGSKLRANHMATADAPLVAALRRAGAIILGKTVTVEFACFDPSPTLNPWDPAFRHTPGGSSSGSAVALAMGMCLGSLGTQTGGSLVRPSSYCGIATCKPTFGLLSREGIVPVSYSLDHPGPMARTVGDLAILLRCLWGEGRWHGNRVVMPPRIAMLTGFFIDEADPAIRKTTQTAVDALQSAGAQIEYLATPKSFYEVRAMHRCLMAVEAAAYHRQSFAAHRNAYGPMITELLDEGLTIAGVDYADMLDAQRRFAREVDALFERADVLLCPSTDTTAPATLTTTGLPKFQAPWSCSGVPVVSIPCGLADDNMPAAIQLVGRRLSEPMLLQVAEWCEQQLGFQCNPPLLQPAD
jgi:aspartyl-tRNA(Asn)/glutamyl-tRNA(Gln) amidotransferase subunit A